MEADDEEEEKGQALKIGEEAETAAQCSSGG